VCLCLCMLDPRLLRTSCIPAGFSWWIVYVYAREEWDAPACGGGLLWVAVAGVGLHVRGVFAVGWMRCTLSSTWLLAHSCAQPPELPQVRTVVLATDQAVVAVDCDHGVKGHRRALPEFDDVSGFRVWEVVPTPEPTRTFGTRVFGLSQGAAIPNLALVWPQRFTWHSDFQVRGWGRSRFGLAACSFCPLRVCARVCLLMVPVRAAIRCVCVFVQVRSGFTHNEKDFLYVLRQREPATPNSPNTYTVYMNYER
jgi:hypothetical protein